jgi:DNA-binding TFAR19-related protein (PDSD5 family)
MMMQCLEEDARVRLANIASVKPEKAEQLQNIIIANLQRGAITGKINEKMLIELLEQYAEKAAEDEAATKAIGEHDKTSNDVVTKNLIQKKQLIWTSYKGT